MDLNIVSKLVRHGNAGQLYTLQVFEATISTEEAPHKRSV